MLRLFRLGALPPALSQVAVLHENGIPIHLLEFGNVQEGAPELSPPWPRSRWGCPLAYVVPQIFRPAFIFALTLLRLFVSFVRHGKPAFLLAEGLQEEGLTYFLSALFRIPFAVHVHELPIASELSRFNRKLLLLEPALFKRAEFLIFPQEDRARIMMERYRLNTRYHIVFNCPRLRTAERTHFLKERLHLTGKPFFILYMGGVGANNPLEMGISALPFLSSDVHFVICGWGESEKKKHLMELSKKLSVSHRVHFLGVVKDEKWQILDSAHLGYCLYSQAEGRLQFQATASNKVMESIASGLPVVGSATEDFNQFFRQYPVGRAVKSREELVDYVRELTETSSLWSEARDRALRIHRETLNYEHQMKDLLQTFRNYFPLAGKENRVLPTPSDIPQTTT